LCKSSAFFPRVDKAKVLAVPTSLNYHEILIGKNKLRNRTKFGCLFFLEVSDKLSVFGNDCMNNCLTRKNLKVRKNVTYSHFVLADKNSMII